MAKPSLAMGNSLRSRKRRCISLPQPASSTAELNGKNTLIVVLLLRRIVCTEWMRCGLLPQMSLVCMSACVSVCWSHVCTVHKTAEPIEMPFGGWLIWIQRTVCYTGSRSDESICSRKGWQVSDAAFIAKLLRTRFKFKQRYPTIWQY